VNTLNKSTIIQNILKNKVMQSEDFGCAFAPSNIALCKYWGKRDMELNLPYNSSLSIALSGKGTFTRLTPNEKTSDIIYHNHQLIGADETFAQKITKYLDLFRPFTKTYYTIKTEINLPIAAGLASSACGYAALIQALNNLYHWELSLTELSILARLGSGSACRSLWKGFVLWSAGISTDGMDSYGQPIECNWPELRIGILILDNQKKPISSREAMRRTVETSPDYASWPGNAAIDLIELQQAIAEKNLSLLGATAENNALLMHKLMQQATPSINYSLPKTLQAREQLWQLRTTGIQVYFTQDAGPNLKLLFLGPDTEKIREIFPEIEVIAPFNDPKKEEVILVDANDKAIGIEEKWQAHQYDHLHRAFSVFILRRQNNTLELLLQQRNADKYHTPNLWSNTCCSHPRPDEDIVSAATRRLQEEMGFMTDLSLIDKFNYTAKLTNGLTENEIDYLLVGFNSIANPPINRQEVQNYKWMSLENLLNNLHQNPQNYTPWLLPALERIRSSLLVSSQLKI
jgi:diphosphomevalonate decarboxylase